MGRTAKRKPDAHSDADGGAPGECQQRVTSFFPATKSRPRGAALAEEPLRSIDSTDQQENIPPGLQLCHAVEDGRVSRGEIENQVTIAQKHNLPRPLSQLMAERISSALMQSELPSDKIQQTCVIVRPHKRQATSDIVTM